MPNGEACRLSHPHQTMQVWDGRHQALSNSKPPSPPPFGALGREPGAFVGGGRPTTPTPTTHCPAHASHGPEARNGSGPPRFLELQYLELQQHPILLFPSGGRSNLCVQLLGSIMKRNYAPRRAPELNAAEGGTADVRMPCSLGWRCVWWCCYCWHGRK